jgi:hypothetical protein
VRTFLQDAVSAVTVADKEDTAMRRRHFRIVFVTLLAAGSLLTAASPAWADGTGFDKEWHEVNEAASYIDLAVRAGVWHEQGHLDYHTADLTAVAGEDYQQESGTLWFAGNSWATIRVPITNDELFEGEERFEVRLTNFTGSFVTRGYEATVVRILDDDHPKPSSGTSSSSGRSNYQAAGSQIGSSAPTPSRPSTDTGSSALTQAGNQSGELNLDEPPLPSEPWAWDEAEPFSDKAAPSDNPPSTPRPVDLATLLLLTITAAAFVFKRSPRRRLTANPPELGDVSADAGLRMFHQDAPPWL